MITLGGTRLELTYHGLSHSDSTLVMRLPEERIIFVVDTIPVGTLPGRGMIDFYPLEIEDFMRQVLTMEWDRLIPGHPGVPGGRLGTKKDVQDQLELLQAARAEMKKLGQDGKCWNLAENSGTEQSCQGQDEGAATSAGHTPCLPLILPNRATVRFSPPHASCPPRGRTLQAVAGTICW